MSSNCSEQQALFCEFKSDKDMIENSNRQLKRVETIVLGSST